ncbi:MAG: tRNA (guanosine(37)-N1)-methyltransferase TrmD [Bacteroidetes bacterium]|nr:tRNA (guanosine(37)-N1)-methyltransferase TrmD [Bacteroidota bacterium]MCL5025435.1 tRNA (guanosine(37)-N1)-methyltransferase TrmD [Chloroflexota bacterium]
MRFDIFTLFPGMFEGPFSHSIIQRALARGLAEINLHNIRDYATDRHRTTDDYPFGGGPGMVMKPEPIFAAVESVLAAAPPSARRIVLMSPQGRLFRQSIATELAGLPHLLLICGHYEGVDERVRRHLVDDEISIGDYILTGGELPAMVVIDAVLRLQPGVLHDEQSAAEESHTSGLLEYPQYTRPAEFRGWRVPGILSSGDHAAVAAWRRRQALLHTFRRRPDLLPTADLTPAERALVAVWEGWAREGMPIPDEA